MAQAEFCDTPWNPIALDWGRTCIEPPRQPAPTDGAVWQRTWPVPAAVEARAPHRLAAAADAGWAGSTQDLRAGLVVIELHAATPELALALAALRPAS
jgi:hypothetical protein